MADADDSGVVAAVVQRIDPNLAASLDSAAAAAIRISCSGREGRED